MKVILALLLLPATILAKGGYATTASFQLTVRHSVQLSWAESSSSVTNFNVYRGTAPGKETSTPYATVKVGAQAANYTWFDTGVTAGGNYCYYLTALNGTLTSSPSNEACATVPNP